MDQQRLCLRVASNPKFSGQGNESWEKWLSHFELRFSEVEKAQRSGILIDLLEGIALDECAKLTSKGLQNYETLKNTLQDRFGSKVDTLQAYAELAQAKQQPGEGVEAFGDRIMRLVENAFPNTSTIQKQEHGVKQFVCGLADERLQEKLIAKDDLVSLNDAVKVARQLRVKENVLDAVRGKKPGEIAMAASHEQSSNKYRGEGDPDPNWAEMKTQLVQIQGAIAQLEARMSDRGHMQGTRENTDISLSRRGCYHCGKPGHIKRQCPQLMGRRGGDPQRARGPPTSEPERHQPFCVACGRDGHWMTECWRVQRGSRDAWSRDAANRSNQAPRAAASGASPVPTDQGNEQ